ncbi:uncharacterized protein [Panulirus ornatus]|uniref:uncharacterized protein n=1 Tax=Panulirus ornatus TaxID=150431 RepID=UPI003A85CBDD
MRGSLLLLRVTLLQVALVTQGGSSRGSVSRVEVRSEVQHRYAFTLLVATLTNVRAGPPRDLTLTMLLPRDAFVSSLTIETGGRNYTTRVTEKHRVGRRRPHDHNDQGRRQPGRSRTRETQRFRASAIVASQETATFYLSYEELLHRVHGRYTYALHLLPHSEEAHQEVHLALRETEPIKDFRILQVPVNRYSGDVQQEVVSSREIHVSYRRGSSSSSNTRNILSNSSNTRNILSNSSSNEDEDSVLSVSYDVDRMVDGGEIQLLGNFFVHYFCPEGLPKLPTHTVFVLDVSGSMHDYGKLDQLKLAMESILKGMPPEDSFEVSECEEDEPLVVRGDGRGWKLLLRQVSADNRGFTRRIDEHSRPAEQLQDFYGEIASPLMTDVDVLYLEDEVKPNSVVRQGRSTYYYSGNEVVLAGELADGATEVNPIVGGQGKEGPLQFRVSRISSPDRNADKNNYVERLWAYLTVLDLLETQEIVDDRNLREEMRVRAKEIAIKFKFLTKLTSLEVVNPENSNGGVHQGVKSASRHQKSNTEALGPRMDHDLALISVPDFAKTLPANLSSRIYDSGYSRGYAFGDNDPHFVVQVPGLELPFCFDIHGSPGDVFSLVRDQHSGILVNGEVTAAAGRPGATYFTKIFISLGAVNFTITPTRIFVDCLDDEGDPTVESVSTSLWPFKKMRHRGRKGRRAKRPRRKRKSRRRPRNIKPWRHQQHPQQGAAPRRLHTLSSPWSKTARQRRVPTRAQASERHRRHTMSGRVHPQPIRRPPHSRPDGRHMPSHGANPRSQATPFSPQPRGSRKRDYPKSTGNYGHPQSATNHVQSRYSLQVPARDLGNYTVPYGSRDSDRQEAAAAILSRTARGSSHPHGHHTSHLGYPNTFHPQSRHFIHPQSWVDLNSRHAISRNAQDGLESPSGRNFPSTEDMRENIHEAQPEDPVQQQQPRSSRGRKTNPEQEESVVRECSKTFSWKKAAGRRYGDVVVALRNRRKLDLLLGDVDANLLVTRTKNRHGQHFLGFYLENHRVLSLTPLASSVRSPHTNDDAGACHAAAVKASLEENVIPEYDTKTASGILRVIHVTGFLHVSNTTLICIVFSQVESVSTSLWPFKKMRHRGRKGRRAKRPRRKRKSRRRPRNIKPWRHQQHPQQGAAPRRLHTLSSPWSKTARRRRVPTRAQASERHRRHTMSGRVHPQPIRRPPHSRPDGRHMPSHGANPSSQATPFSPQPRGSRKRDYPKSTGNYGHPQSATNHVQSRYSLQVPARDLGNYTVPYGSRDSDRQEAAAAILSRTARGSSHPHAHHTSHLGYPNTFHPQSRHFIHPQSWVDLNSRHAISRNAQDGLESPSGRNFPSTEDMRENIHEAQPEDPVQQQQPRSSRGRKTNPEQEESVVRECSKTFSWKKAAGRRYGDVVVALRNRRKLDLLLGDVDANLLVTRTKNRHGQHFLGFYLENHRVLSPNTTGIIGQFAYKTVGTIGSGRNTAQTSQAKEVRLAVVQLGPARRYEVSEVNAFLSSRRSLLHKTHVTCLFIRHQGRGLVAGSPDDYLLPCLAC